LSSPVLAAHQRKRASGPLSAAIFDGVQNLGALGGGSNQSVWLVFSKTNATTKFEFDCDDENKNLLALFKLDTVVKNFFFPYEEYTLKASKEEIFVDSVKEFHGCLDSI